MERTLENWEDKGVAQGPGASQVALKAVSHRTLLVGVLYATTIIVVLMIVTKL
jgi:hypothetical protein